MSVFTNPADRSVEHAEAYVSAVLELVGNRDPMEILRATPASIRELLSGAPAEALARPEAPGKWSVREVVRHVTDAELVWAFRLRLVLAQDRPALQGFDQDAWADRLHYREADLDEALEEFLPVRRGNLRLLQRATAEDLRRVGHHAERGEESVERMIRLYAGHDLLHLRQMRRILEAVGA